MGSTAPQDCHVLSEKDHALNGSKGLPTLQATARRLISTYEMVVGIVLAGLEAGLVELDVGSIIKAGNDIAEAFTLFRTADDANRPTWHYGQSVADTAFAVCPTRTPISWTIGNRLSTRPSRWVLAFSSSSTMH